VLSRVTVIATLAAAPASSVEAVAIVSALAGDSVYLLLFFQLSILVENLEEHAPISQEKLKVAPTYPITQIFEHFSCNP